MTDTDRRGKRRPSAPDLPVRFSAVVAVDGTVLRINQGAPEGWQDDPASGPLWRLALWGAGNPAVQGRVTAMIGRAAGGDVATREARVTLAPGHVVNVLHKIRPVTDEDGTVTALLATVQGIPAPDGQSPADGAGAEAPESAAADADFSRFEGIYAAEETGIALHDTRLAILRANAAWADMGGDPLRALVSGGSGAVSDCTGAGTDPKICALIRSVLASGRPVHGVAVGSAAGPVVADIFPLRPDGPQGSVRAVATCLRRTASGAPARDGDSAVRANLERLLEGLPAPATLHEGREHRFSYANATARRVLDGQQVLGRTLADVISGYDLPETLPRFDAVFRDGAQDVAAEFEMPPGSGRFYYNALLPWHHSDGTVGGVLSYGHEITQSVQARRDVTEARDRLRQMLDATGAMMAVLARDGTILEANSALLTSVGAARHDVLSRLVWECDWWCAPPNPAQRPGVPAPEPEADGVPQRLRAAVGRAAAGVAERIEGGMACHPAGLRDVEVEIRPLASWADGSGAMVLTAVDVTERQRATAQARFLLEEINHRSKNLLGVVQSIARQMGRYEFDDFADAFGARLQSLAAAQDLLIRGDSAPVTLYDLVLAQLGHLSHLFDTQIVFDGPGEVLLSPQATQSLSIALYELATNAEKHGALLTADGLVRVTWGLDGSQFWLDWRESGGPPVAPPSRRGFGTFVLERVASRNLDAGVEIDWAPGGLHWRLETSRSSTLAPPVAAQTARPGQGAPYVLIAESEPLLGFEMAERLRTAGYAVCGPARTVAEALDLLDSVPCAACVTDLDLGGQRAEALTDRLVDAGIPLVRVSAYPADAWPPGVQEAPYMAKPVDFRRLVGLIAALATPHTADRMLD